MSNYRESAQVRQERNKELYVVVYCPYGALKETYKPEVTYTLCLFKNQFKSSNLNVADNFTGSLKNKKQKQPEKQAENTGVLKLDFIALCQTSFQMLERRKREEKEKVGKEQEEGEKRMTLRGGKKEKQRVKRKRKEAERD